MQEIRQPFIWPTLIHDFNSQKVKAHDVLRHREMLVKKYKKLYNNKTDFANALRKDFMSQYWSRCEYEMLLYVENERVYLMPWTGRFINGNIDITDNAIFDWMTFAKWMLKQRGWPDRTNNRTYVKFDIYDQIMFRFDELVDFCWNYQHKYQRRKKEEN